MVNCSLGKFVEDWIWTVPYRLQKWPLCHNHFLFCSTFTYQKWCKLLGWSGTIHLLKAFILCRHFFIVLSIYLSLCVYSDLYDVAIHHSSRKELVQNSVHCASDDDAGWRNETLKWNLEIYSERSRRGNVMRCKHKLDSNMDLQSSMTWWINYFKVFGHLQQWKLAQL